MWRKTESISRSSPSTSVSFAVTRIWVALASSRMTEARPTSEPVPAVVGTATIGAMPASSAAAITCLSRTEPPG